MTEVLSVTVGYRVGPFKRIAKQYQQDAHEQIDPIIFAKITTMAWLDIGVTMQEIRNRLWLACIDL